MRTETGVMTEPPRAAFFCHLLILAMVATALAGCKRESGAGQMMQRPPPMVSVVAATTADVPLYLEQIGKCVSPESVIIQPQVTGKLMEVHVRDGQEVKKGDLLFTIDPRPFEATLAQAQAQLAQAQAAAKLAESELNRVLGLRNTGAVSPSEVDQKQNTLLVAQAQVKVADAAVARARLDVEYCVIHSPLDGRAGERLVDPGNIVSSSGPNGGTNLLSIQRLTPIDADFTIAEQRLDEVRRYMAEGTLKTLVWTPAEPEQVRQGELQFLDNAVQDGSGTVKLRATLANEDRHFWPGQFVQVRLVLKVLKDTVMVPSPAQMLGAQGPYVYVVKDNKAEMRPIQPGQRQGDMLVVSKGLSAGEQVIVEGQMTVMPDGPVQIAPAAPAPAQAPAQATTQGEPGTKPVIAEGAGKS